MYIYKNISGKTVNVRGVAFGVNGEIRSNIIIGGFQDAINSGVLSFCDTTVVQMKEQHIEAEAPKTEEPVHRKYTRKGKAEAPKDIKPAINDKADEDDIE